MSGRYHLVELCCGSAALTMHLMGSKRQVVPYHGSKWKVRRELESFLSSSGFTDLQTIMLNDIGPWGRTWRALVSSQMRSDVSGRLSAMHRDYDARELYDRLQGQRVPSDVVQYAAEHLFLQRISVSGKAVGTSDGRWKSPGFNKTSAYGCPPTDRFGAIKPMIPSLIGVLDSMDDLDWPNEISVHQAQAYEVDVLPRRIESSVIYIDPPYQSTTCYPNGNIDRSSLIALAKWWFEAGAAVIVSESEPLQPLVDEGWRAVCLRGTSSDNKPFQSKSAEWITSSGCTPPRRLSPTPSCTSVAAWD